MSDRTRRDVSLRALALDLATGAAAAFALALAVGALASPAAGPLAALDPTAGLAAASAAAALVALGLLRLAAGTPRPGCRRVRGPRHPEEP